MYQVYFDGNNKIYDSQTDKYLIFDAQLELELNKTGSFTFTMYPEHQHYGELQKMKSIVTVHRDGDIIFRGRVLNEETGFYNEKHVTCEGELAFLLDSIIRPYGSEAAPWKGTPAEYFKKLIDEHNEQVDEEKQFTIGVVTVTDGDTSNTENQISRYDTEYKATLELLTEKLVGSLGGYLWIDYAGGKRRLNYLADFMVNDAGEWTSEGTKLVIDQKIEFGKNLLDLKTTIKGEEVFTGIIPLGSDDGTDSRTTIKKVDDYETEDFIKTGDCIVHKRVSGILGKIFRTVTWDDVTEPENLKKKAEEYLANAINFPTSIDLTSADLSKITGTDPFRMGRYLIIKSTPHNLDELGADVEFLIKKLSINLLEPASNTLTVGATFKTLTESTNSSTITQTKLTETVKTVVKNTSVSQTGVYPDMTVGTAQKVVNLLTINYDGTQHSYDGSAPVSLTIDVDRAPTPGSVNLITSGAVYEALEKKQNKLKAGKGISIINDVISADFEGNGFITVQADDGIEDVSPGTYLFIEK